MGSLRDKFEGQAFLNKKLEIISSYFAVLDVIGVKRPEVDNSLLALNLDEVVINRKQYQISVTEFGSLPKFKKTVFDRPVIFVFKKSLSSYSVAGVATKEVLNLKDNYLVSGSQNNYFMGFEKLKNIDCLTNE